MYLKLSNITYLSYSEKRILVGFLTFFLLFEGLTLYLCDRMAQSSSQALIEGWIQGEAIEIEQGNLFSVLSRAQRIFTGSGVIAGGEVKSIAEDLSQKSVFSFGLKGPVQVEAREVGPGKLEMRRIGFLEYQYHLIPENKRNYMFVVIASPTSMQVMSLLATVLIGFAMLALTWVTLARVQSRMDLIRDAVGDVVNGEISQEIRDQESVQFVKILSSLADNLKQKKMVEKENILLQAVNSVAKQVAHDIRSPLMALEMALRGDVGLSEERKSLLNQANRRIRTIADDLLKKSRGVQATSAQKPTDKSEKVETFEAVPSVLAILEEKRASYPNISIQTDGLPSSVQIPGEAGEFERLLSNILQNAIEAVSDVHDPRVNVAIRKYYSQIQLSILDNGKGIPSEILSRISEEGFSYDKAYGNGLGVSSAKRKVAEWGGKLEIQSRLGMGTMVTLQFATSDQLAASV